LTSFFGSAIVGAIDSNYRMLNRKKPCPHCKGTGLDPSLKSLLGPKLRLQRLKRWISAKEMAIKLGVSPTLLCYLERDARKWKPELLKKYKEALRND
jgi:hypothetical protein